MFGTGKVEFGNNSFSDGPVMGSEIVLANNVTTNAFPTVTTVPVGMPVQPGGLRAAEPAASVRRLSPDSGRQRADSPAFAVGTVGGVRLRPSGDADLE